MASRFDTWNALSLCCLNKLNKQLLFLERRFLWQITKQLSGLRKFYSALSRQSASQQLPLSHPPCWHYTRIHFEIRIRGGPPVSPYRSHFKRICSRNCLRRFLIGQVSLLSAADITIPSKKKISAEWRLLRRTTISRGANWKVLSFTSPFEFYEEVLSKACNGVNKPCKWHAVAILGQYAC